MILNYEQQISLKVHNKGTPLLISSLLLRSYGAGQVDVAVIKENEIHLVEVKNRGDISYKQIGRLKKTGHFLSKIFKKNIFLWGARKTAPYWYQF